MKRIVLPQSVSYAFLAGFLALTGALLWQTYDTTLELREIANTQASAYEITP